MAADPAPGCVPVGRRGVPALADGLFFLRWLVGGDAKLYRTLCALFPPVLFPDSTALGGDRTHSQQRDGAGWGGALWNVALIPDDLVAVAGGSVLVFWLARVLGQRFVERLVNQRVADKYLEVIRRKRDIFLILVFLFPFFPDDLICILAGLTDIPLHRFFLIVLLTRPWGLLVACALGGSVLTIPVWAMLLLGAAGVAVFAVCLKYGDRWEAALLERFKR